MKTIYLDHNIVHFFVKGFPPKYSEEAERRSLRAALCLHPDIRFVVSDWHIAEIAREFSNSSSAKDLADRYTTFLDSLRPIFLYRHDHVKKEELKNLALHKWRGASARLTSETEVFADYFSQIVSTDVRDMLVGYSIGDALRYFVKNPEALICLRASVDTAFAAIETNHEAFKRGRYGDPLLETEIMRATLLRLLPDRDADKKWIDVQTREDWARQLSSAPDEVWNACPTIHIEWLTTRQRAELLSHPTPADTFDLMHSIPALAYCSAFVSGDKRLRKWARKACTKAGQPVIVESNLNETVRKLGLNRREV